MCDHYNKKFFDNVLNSVYYNTVIIVEPKLGEVINIVKYPF